MIRMILASAFVFVFSSLVNAQKLKREDVLGFWKLKEAGFYEGKTKVKKDFDNCRLMRNYALREDGFAVYNYVGGSVGDCTPSEPRLSFWRIVDNRIQFFVDDKNILEEVVVTFNNDKTMLFSSYIPVLAKNSDAKVEAILNTVHYSILEKLY
ncbi:MULTISPECIES: lipocalin family protein [Chryseobacterium]|uniref:lipocalin family protein n=1 Tax=Chryseobacterium TaxID=59732 RepID=UPI000D12D2BA|nr:lipocalin family protein [Chryseobacterium aurantiacum]